MASDISNNKKECCWEFTTQTWGNAPVVGMRLWMQPEHMHASRAWVPATVVRVFGHNMLGGWGPWPVTTVAVRSNLKETKLNVGISSIFEFRWLDSRHLRAWNSDAFRAGDYRFGCQDHLQRDIQQLQLLNKQREMRMCRVMTRVEAKFFPVREPSAEATPKTQDESRKRKFSTSSSSSSSSSSSPSIKEEHIKQYKDNLWAAMRNISLGQLVDVQFDQAQWFTGRILSVHGMDEQEEGEGEEKNSVPGFRVYMRDMSELFVQVISVLNGTAARRISTAAFSHEPSKKLTFHTIPSIFFSIDRADYLRIDDVRLFPVARIPSRLPWPVSWNTVSTVVGTINLKVVSMNNIDPDTKSTPTLVDFARSLVAIHDDLDQARALDSLLVRVCAEPWNSVKLLRCLPNPSDLIDIWRRLVDIRPSFVSDNLTPDSPAVELVDHSIQLSIPLSVFRELGDDVAVLDLLLRNMKLAPDAERSNTTPAPTEWLARLMPAVSSSSSSSSSPPTASDLLAIAALKTHAQAAIHPSSSSSSSSSTSLVDYQATTVAWMAQQEETIGGLFAPHTTECSGSDTHEYGQMFHASRFWLAPGAVISEPNESGMAHVNGGILADESGLGKTVECIDLVRRHTHKENIRQPPPTEYGAGGLTPSCATLIVCASDTVETWHKNLRSTGMRVALTRGKEVVKYTAEQLATCHIVLTTDETLCAERGRAEQHLMRLIHGEPWTVADVAVRDRGSLCSYRSPLHRVNWYRVILDGSSRYTRLHASDTKAVLQLVSCRRWCISEQPLGRISSGDDDDTLRVMLTFLGLGRLFYDVAVMRKPGREHIRTQLLRELMQHTCIRHERHRPYLGRPQLLVARRLVQPHDLPPTGDELATHKQQVKAAIEKLAAAPTSTSTSAEQVWHDLVQPLLVPFSSKIDTVVRELRQRKIMSDVHVLFCGTEETAKLLALRLGAAGIPEPTKVVVTTVDKAGTLTNTARHVYFVDFIRDLPKVLHAAASCIDANGDSTVHHLCSPNTLEQGLIEWRDRHANNTQEPWTIERIASLLHKHSQ